MDFVLSMELKNIENNANSQQRIEACLSRHFSIENGVVGVPHRYPMWGSRPHSVA